MPGKVHAQDADAEDTERDRSRSAGARSLTGTLPRPFSTGGWKLSNSGAGGVMAARMDTKIPPKIHTATPGHTDPVAVEPNHVRHPCLGSLHHDPPHISDSSVSGPEAMTLSPVAHDTACALPMNTRTKLLPHPPSPAECVRGQRGRSSPARGLFGRGPPMRAGSASAMAARRAGGRPGLVAMLGLGVVAALLAGCGVAMPEAGAVPQQQAVAAPPPRTAQPLDAAAAGLTDALLANAGLASSGRRPLMIDPLIDRATGFYTAATRSIEARIERRVRDHHPQVEMRPFTIAGLADQPLILLGTMAGAAEAGSLKPAVGAPSIYRIWAALIDLRTDRVLGREMVWVHAADVDPTPTTFFRDKPVESPGPGTAAYLRTCSSSAGAPIDPVYLQALPTQALVAQSIAFNEAHRY